MKVLLPLSGAAVLLYTRRHRTVKKKWISGFTFFVLGAIILADICQGGMMTNALQAEVERLFIGLVQGGCLLVLGVTFAFLVVLLVIACLPKKHQSNPATRTA